MIAENNGLHSAPADGGVVPVSHASSIPKNGWPLRPFQIVSLLDMIEADVKELVGLIAGLVSIKKNLEDNAAERFKAGGEPKEVRAELAAKHGAGILAWINHAERVCSKYGMDITYWTRQADGYVHQPERYKTTLSEYINGVKHGIYEKLEQRKFMYMPDDEAKYYDQDQLFGEDVDAAFSEASLDIKSAGNCVACGLFTASVYHSMRVAEFGLRRIAAKLRVKLKDKGQPMPIEFGTWDKVITACKNKIDKTRKRPIGPKRQAELEFYSDAADHCLFMKDIWRNNISHTRKPYNEPEALAVLERVKDFMKFVAVRS